MVIQAVHFMIGLYKDVSSNSLLSFVSPLSRLYGVRLGERFTRAASGRAS